MTLKAELIFTADASQVKTAAAAVKSDLGGVTQETVQSSAALEKHAAALERDAQAATRAAGAARDLGAAEAAARQKASSAGANDNRTRPAGGTSNFNVSNIASQGFDILTTAPFMPIQTVALQQGPQLVQALEQIKASGQSVGKTLLAAFTSLISPMSLLTIGLVAGGAAAIQYFSSIETGAKSVDDILAKHAENVKSLGPAYAKALDEQKKYLDPSIVGARMGDNFTDAQKRLTEDARKASAEIYSALTKDRQAGGIDLNGIAFPSQFDGARKAIDAFNASIQAGAPKAKAFQAAIIDLVSSGELSESAAKKLRQYSDAAVDAEDKLSGLTKAPDAVAVAYANLQTAIDRINPYGATGRLADVDKTLSELMRNVRAGETNVSGLNQTLNSLSGANPDLSKAIGSIRSLFLEAIKASSALETLRNGEAFPDAGVAPKGARPGNREADLELFLRTNVEFGKKLQDQYDEQERKAKAASRSGRADANAYRDLLKSADDRIAQMKLEVEVSGETGIAADTLRFKLDLLQKGEDKGRSLTGEQVAAINSRVEAFKKYAEEAGKAKLQADLLFDREQLGRSSFDQQIASSLRGAGLAVDFDSYEAGLIRTNLQLKYARDLTGDFVDTLSSSLESGKGLWESLGDAAVSSLKRIADTLLNDVLNSLFQVNSAAGGGGGGGLLSSIFGLFTGGSSGGSAFNWASSGDFDFDTGGYTGSGGVKEPRGIVHAGEVVWSQRDVARAGGVGVVEAMRLGHRGYDVGGAVDVRPISYPRAGRSSSTMAPAPVVFQLQASISGNGDKELQARLQQTAEELMRGALDNYNRNVLPGRVSEIQNDPYAVG